MNMEIIIMKLLFSKNALLLLICIGLISFVISAFFSYLPSTVEREKKLEMEYTLIQQPPEAHLESYNVTRKSSGVRITATYKYKQSSNEIFEYFNSELVDNNWSEEGYREYPSKNFIQKEYIFKKDDINFIIMEVNPGIWSLHLGYQD